MRFENEHITEIAGYRLLELIGSGGMGEVYKAYNNSLNRFAAVKILYQAAYADRFKNEAYIQSSVNHPNIARLYEYAECGDKHCIVMEYIKGETLDHLLHRKGKLSNEETENITRQIVSALAYLHKKDIMHRDIKPQNFKIEGDGTVKMLDFGIAKHKYSPKFTQLGFVVGTTEYLAPEQLQQAPELKSDVWALAVLIYELLTGYMPFEASNALTLQSKIRKANYTDPKILVPYISEKLSLIIDKSLKVNPANRISAGEIERIMGKIKQTTGINMARSFQFPAISRKLILPGMISIVVLLILVLILNKGTDVKPDTNDIAPATEIADDTRVMKASDVENNIIINVPGIKNAELILQDGIRQRLPYTMSGKEGDKFEFTIHADGYKDKEVQVILTPRRISYEFNLEKNNN